MEKPRMCEIILYEDNIEKILEIIKNKDSIDKYVCIKHDKDLYTAADELKNSKNKAGTLKKAHWHMYLHFKESRYINEIAKWFNIKTNRIEKIKYGWINAVMYSIHLNAPEKYQYPPECVLSNYDWQAEIEKHNEKISSKKRLEAIIKGIDEGAIRLHNLDKNISMDEFIKWKKEIEKAFEYRQLRLRNAKEHEVEVMYLYGKAGTGKTSYAINYCQEKGISYYITGTSNDPFQNYAGEECLIIDELRAETFRLSDLLRMLDNNNGGCVSARYRNKILECSVIILTTSKTIEELFEELKGSENESIVQLKRRCKTMLHFEQEKIEVVCYDLKKEDYDWTKVSVIENPIAELHKKGNLKEEEIEKRVENLQILGAKSIVTVEELTEEIKPIVTAEESIEEIRPIEKRDSNEKYIRIFM